MLMHQMYGVRTSVVYDVDGVAQRLGPSTIGYEDRPASYDDMRASDVAHFVKTAIHRSAPGTGEPTC